MTDAPKLLSCPFCGARPHKQLGKVWHDSLHGDKHQNTIIKCPHLCVTMEGSECGVITRWNTRTDQHLALVAAAEELAKVLVESEHAINWSFSAGTEEREGGSGRRQGKLNDKVRDWQDRRRAALAAYRKAMDGGHER